MREINGQLLNDCEDGNLSKVKELLDKDVDVNIKNGYGRSPLIMAACHKHTETVKLLLDRGADTEVINDCGHTAVSYAFDIKDKEKEKRQEILELFNHYCPEAFMAEYMDRNTGMGR